MGIVLAGAGLGGLVLSPVTQTLLDRIGIRWTLRVLGTWNFLVGLPVASVLRAKHAAARGRGQTRMNFAMMRRGTFILQVSKSLLEKIVRFQRLYSLWVLFFRLQGIWCRYIS